MLEVTTNQRIEATPGIAGGKPRITGHRITVQDVVIWHEWLGRSADEIAVEYGLDLADVYAALAYYYENQIEMDQIIRQQESFIGTLRQRSPSKLAPRLVSAAHG